MSTKKRVPAILMFSLAICLGPATAHAADDGLITKPSKYSVEETVARFEAAVRQREAAGFTVFTEIDHAAAARKFGFDMRPRTVILFGNPKVGPARFSSSHNIGTARSFWVPVFGLTGQSKRNLINALK